MPYVSLPEAAASLERTIGVDVSASQLLRAGIAGELLLVALFSGLMRNLVSHKDEDVLGLLVIPPRHLLEIQTDGKAKIRGASSLDGKVMYSPEVVRTLADLHITLPELARFEARVKTAMPDKAKEIDHLFHLEVRADKPSFTVAEALEATSAAIHPDSAAKGPTMILSIDKVEHPPKMGDVVDGPTSLTDADWLVLRSIWEGLPVPEFPMPAEQWAPYMDAFNSSTAKPVSWSLSAVQRNPEFQTALKRAVALHDHRDILKRAVRAGKVALRNPTTGAVSELGWVGDADSWLLTRSDMKAFCDLLGIELRSAREACLGWGFVVETLKGTPGRRAALLLEYMLAIEARAGDDLPSTITIGGRCFQVSSDLLDRLDILPGVDAALLDLTNPKFQSSESPPSEVSGELSTRTHEVKRRSDPLTAALAQAEREALDPKDWQSVWAALVALAQRKTPPAPLVGYVEGEGVQYRADDPAKPTAYLTREAFRKRFERKRKGKR